MNSLPPEMIREIYTKMDARTAYKFRRTCRDYNRVFLDNPSAIERFDTTLYIAFMGDSIEVMIRMPNFIHEGKLPFRPFNTFLIRKFSEEDQEDDEALFDCSKERLLAKRVSDILARDPVEVLLNVVANIRTAFQFTEAMLIRRDTLSNIILDDRVLQMLVDLAIDLEGTLGIHYLDFRFTEIENWYRLLEITNAKALEVGHCLLHSLNLFPEDVVRRGLNKLSYIRVFDNTSDDFVDVGLKNLLRKDSIRHLDLNVPIDSQYIMDKLTRYINGDCQPTFLAVAFRESDRTTLFKYLDRTSRREDSESEHNYVISTKEGTREAFIYIGYINGSWRFQFRPQLC